MSHLICGIDPGKKGALCFLESKGGRDEITFALMPLDKDGNVCGRQLAGYLNQMKPDRVIVEQVNAMPGQGVVSMFSFGYGFGVVIGVLGALHIPFETVRPQVWQKVCYKGLDKKIPTKERSVIAAKRLFPLQSFTPHGCKVPNNGLTDALLLAYYSRQPK